MSKTHTLEPDHITAVGRLASACIRAFPGILDERTALTAATEAVRLCFGIRHERLLAAVALASANIEATPGLQASDVINGLPWRLQDSINLLQEICG